MQNLTQETKLYNDESVFFCKKCLSLRVRIIHNMKDSEYCDECGSTDIGETSILEWENMYQLRYGHKYLDNY